MGGLAGEVTGAIISRWEAEPLPAGIRHLTSRDGLIIAFTGPPLRSFAV